LKMALIVSSRETMFSTRYTTKVEWEQKWPSDYS
jgi:hypothetical protein